MQLGKRWMVLAVYSLVCVAVAIGATYAFKHWQVRSLEAQRAEAEKRAQEGMRPWPNPSKNPNAFAAGEMGPRYWRVPAMYTGTWYRNGLLHLRLTWPGIYPPASLEARNVKGIDQKITVFITPPQPVDPKQRPEQSLLERAEQEVALGNLLPAKRLANGLLEYANPKSGDGKYYIPYAPEIYTEKGLRWGISCGAFNKPEPDPKKINCGAGETYADGVHVGYEFKKTLLDDWYDIYHEINKLIKSFERR